MRNYSSGDYEELGHEVTVPLQGICSLPKVEPSKRLPVCSTFMHNCLESAMGRAVAHVSNINALIEVLALTRLDPSLQRAFGQRRLTCSGEIRTVTNGRRLRHMPRP
jgi:hypothetical protein